MGYSTYTDLVPIIERPRLSPSVAQEQPYLEIQGGIQGAVSVNAQSDSSALYPALVDTASDGDQPANFDAPSSSDFLSWHTAWQIKYIQQKNPIFLNTSIGSGADKISVFLGDGAQSEKVFVVQNLQKSDIGMMTMGTQERLASLSDWNADGGLADKYGYSKNATIASLRASLKSTLRTEYINKMTKPSGSVMTDADVKLFTRQIDNIMTRLDNSSVFNTAQIKTAAELVYTRYKRAAAFAISPSLNSSGLPKQGEDFNAADTLQVGGLPRYPDPSIIPNAISTDGNQYINKGYEKFISEEKRILQADNAKIKLGSLIAAQPQNMDLPRLIFFLQMNDDLTKNRQNIANTEELKQQNRYVQDLSIVQRLLNKTIGKFGTGTGERLDLLANGTIELSNGNGVLKTAYANNLLSKDEMAIFSMFEKNNTDLSYTAHPIEALRNLPKRPTLNLGIPTDVYPQAPKQWVLALSSLPRSTWENYQTMVSDYINNVNMATSALQNENQSLDREKNRHYDLANNSISKMFEMLQTITRS